MTCVWCGSHCASASAAQGCDALASEFVGISVLRHVLTPCVACVSQCVWSREVCLFDTAAAHACARQVTQKSTYKWGVQERASCSRRVCEVTSTLGSCWGRELTNTCHHKHFVPTSCLYVAWNLSCVTSLPFVLCVEGASWCVH